MSICSSALCLFVLNKYSTEENTSYSLSFSIIRSIGKGTDVFLANAHLIYGSLHCNSIFAISSCKFTSSIKLIFIEIYFNTLYAAFCIVAKSFSLMSPILILCSIPCYIYFCGSGWYYAGRDVLLSIILRIIVSSFLYIKFNSLSHEYSLKRYVQFKSSSYTNISAFNAIFVRTTVSFLFIISSACLSVKFDTNLSLFDKRRRIFMSPPSHRASRLFSLKLDLSINYSIIEYIFNPSNSSTKSS